MARLSKITVAFAGCLLAFGAKAQINCDVALAHGLVITDDVIRIVDKGQTRVQINYDQQLFIRGHHIDLSEQDTHTLTTFSRGLRETVPELVELATDGVNIGLDAIERVVAGISEKEPEVLKEQLQYVERAMMEKFKRGDDFFYIAPQSLSQIDDFFKKEISEKIHSAVHGSLGALLVALGDAFRSTEGNIEERINDMGARMEIISTEIDKSLQKKAAVLEQKASQYCNYLNALDNTESELHRIVPGMSDYDLVKVKPLS